MSLLLDIYDIIRFSNNKEVLRTMTHAWQKVVNVVILNHKI